MNNILLRNWVCVSKIVVLRCKKNKRTWLITGASSGVGEEFCKQLIDVNKINKALSKKKKEKYNQRINTLKHLIEWGI